MAKTLCNACKNLYKEVNPLSMCTESVTGCKVLMRYWQALLSTHYHNGPSSSINDFSFPGVVLLFPLSTHFQNLVAWSIYCGNTLIPHFIRIICTPCYFCSYPISQSGGSSTMHKNHAFTGQALQLILTSNIIMGKCVIKKMHFVD